MSFLGISIVVIVALVGFLVIWEIRKARSQFNGKELPVGQGAPGIDWEYLSKQPGMKLASLLATVLLAIAMTYFLHPRLWTTLTNKFSHTVSVAESTEFDDSFKSSYRKSAEHGCLDSVEDEFSRRGMSSEQRTRSMPKAQMMCSCMADKSVSALSVSELTELSTGVPSRTLRNKIEKIQSECAQHSNNADASANTVVSAPAPQIPDATPTQNENENTNPVSARLTSQFHTCMNEGDAHEGITYAVVNCLGQEIEAQDAVLNTTYKSVMASLEPTARPALISASRSWIKYRDDKCVSEHQSGGTEDSILIADCILQMTVQRTIELERMIAK